MKPDLTAKTQTFFCPQCGSAAVDVSALQIQAICRNCAWAGPTGELLSQPLQHTLGSEEELRRAFYADVKKVFSQEYGIPLLRLLLRWGYLRELPKGPPLAARVYAMELGRYVADIAAAVGRTIIETREAIELEKGDKKKEDVS